MDKSSSPSARPLFILTTGPYVGSSEDAYKAEREHFLEKLLSFALLGAGKEIPQTDMSLVKNKEFVKRFYTEVIANGDYSNLNEFVSGEYVDHNAEDAGRGPDIVRKHMESMRTTLPDFTLQVEQIVVEGDFVATRVTAGGTHLGEWMGIKPSGRKLKLKGINIDRLKDGKIVEHWGEADSIGMLMQMGVDPFVGRVKQ